jgi:hypothetical protein
VRVVDTCPACGARLGDAEIRRWDSERGQGLKEAELLRRWDSAASASESAIFWVRMQAGDAIRRWPAGRSDSLRPGCG